VIVERRDRQRTTVGESEHELVLETFDPLQSRPSARGRREERITRHDDLSLQLEACGQRRRALDAAVEQ